MAGRVLDLSLHLLDRQVVDTDGGMVCNVDDVEITVPDDGAPPYVSAILCGPGALGPRIGGLLGRWMVAAHRNLGRRREEAPDRIGFELVTDIGSAIVVAESRARLGVCAGEDLVREYLVDRLPGATHESG
jgi:sporulation protein YlmC with PRC-barrel domain